MKALVVLLFCFLEFALQASRENEPNSVEETFEYIARVQNKLVLTKNGNITLVIGNTGSGKSTLTHYAAGDYSQLESIEPDDFATIDYKIRDGLDPENGKVVSNTESRTLVPEKLIDEAGNVWYDCPGFGDTRSEAIELATTFLIKSVIENASNMRIVLVVNYVSFTEAGPRDDLDILVERVIQLIGFVDRFKNSVSLVVSKVPSYVMRGRRIVNIADAAIKTSVANCMRGYRTVQQNAGSNEAKVQLIDALLEMSSDGDYPKISIFWRPANSGPFNTIEELIQGRAKIRKSILEDSSYTEIGANDFGFPLTAAAQRFIDVMNRQTSATITAMLTSLDNQVVSALSQKIESSDSLTDRLELLTACKILAGLSNGDAERLENLTDRFTALIKYLNMTSIQLNVEFNRIKQQENYMKIQKTIAGSEISLSIHDLAAKSSETFQYITKEHRWYSFLVRVFDFFAEYDTQNDKAIYDVANLADWKQPNRTRGLVINEKNVVDFTKRFPGSFEITPTQSKLKVLNSIIKFTLRSPLKYECDGVTMTIKGNFVQSSDIQPSKCSSAQITRINVFVVSTFFVNSDLNLNGCKQLNILADKWVVSAPATFNLSGIDGEAQTRPNYSGAAGQPGNVGMNGGNFLGLWKDIHNGDLLTVKLNAGNGANGQDGTGSDDVEPLFTRTKYTEAGAWSPSNPDPDTYYKRFLKAEGYDADLTLSEKWVKYFAIFAGGTEIKHRFRIHPKHCCAATGRGGPGSFLNKGLRKKSCNCFSFSCFRWFRWTLGQLPVISNRICEKQKAKIQFKRWIDRPRWRKWADMPK